MPNGILKLYKKSDNTTLVDLDILGNFNIEDNLNETPSNMKVKAITTNTYREEFEVNTIAYHADTNTWWVIKSDESTYLHTGEYEHEINLVEFLEFYSYRHLPNCAFAPNTYELEDMMTRLFQIAKLSITTIYPSFLDKDKIMPFMSFENFTVANAIKNIARALNAIPKMYVDTTSGFVPTLTFINRQGLSTAIVNTLDTQFPVAYEKNTNSSDQFVTRSVSNISNAKSSLPILSPEFGGYKNFVPNSLEYLPGTQANRDFARVLLPSKIDSIEFLRIYPPMELYYDNGTGITAFWSIGCYFDKQPIIDIVNASVLFTSGEKTDIISRLPTPEQYAQVGRFGTIDKNYDPLASDNGRASSLFHKKMILNTKFGFDTTSVSVNTDTKDRTTYWLPNTNEIVMSLSFRNGLTNLEDHNQSYVLLSTNGGTRTFVLRTKKVTSGLTSFVPNEEILIQAFYYPIADIKISIDNDNEAQDEKFFNQSGKLIDSVSVSKLITSHTNDSVEGTKIRNARYGSPDYDFTDILPLGQIVRDNNQLYIISQRSIDAQVKNGNEYYNVLYTLSKNRIARSENIIADNSVISYKIPDDNLVSRNQLYKDYIELSLVDEHGETPYLPYFNMLETNPPPTDVGFIGTKFDFTILAKNDYGSTPTVARYVKNPSIFDLHKSKLMVVNWQDNNVLGFTLLRSATDYIQTPIVYTDATGKATNFELLVMNKANLINANAWYNGNVATNPSVPFDKENEVPNAFYTDSVFDRNQYLIRIQELSYAKDPFEIPVFSYMLQGNDSYSNNGNIVIGENIFNTFPRAFGSVARFHYVFSSTRFTNENAVSIFKASIPASNVNRANLLRGGTRIIDVDLFSNIDTNTRNTTAFTNVAIIAYDGVDTQFMFAINDYVESGSNDKDDIRVFINNWKI